MSLRKQTPCDVYVDEEGFHHCPYAEDGDYVNCEYWCGAEEPEDYPEEYEEYEEDESDYEEEMEEEDGWNKWECEPSRDDWDDC